MTDINKELQKLKALINQKQATAIFSNKSNESTKLALGDAELYINDMTRKFSFTRSGVMNPVMIDAKTKSLENVEYLNGVKVEDITGSVIAVENLQKTVDNHEVMISKVEADVDVHEEQLTKLDERITDCEIKDVEQDKRVADLEADVNELEADVGVYNSRITNVETKVTELEETVGKEHNHDDRYSKLNHTHDTYVNITTLYNSLKQCAAADHTHEKITGTLSIGGNLNVTGEINAVNIGIRMNGTGGLYRLSASGGNIYLHRISDNATKILWSGCKTITHQTNLTGELGTFCESTGDIYDGYEKITNIDCICAVKQSTSLNKKIVGIICSEDEFASHGDVLVRVNDITGLEVGDILSPDENGYGKVATEVDLMFMMLHAIPRPKITSLDSGIEGYVACFLV